MCKSWLIFEKNSSRRGIFLKNNILLSRNMSQNEILIYLTVLIRNVLDIRMGPRYHNLNGYIKYNAIRYV